MTMLYLEYKNAEMPASGDLISGVSFLVLHSPLNVNNPTTPPPPQQYWPNHHGLKHYMYMESYEVHAIKICFHCCNDEIIFVSD